MKDQEPSDAEFFELLTRAVTALETIAKGFEEPDSGLPTNAYMERQYAEEPPADTSACPDCGRVNLGKVTCLCKSKPPAEEPCKHEYEPGPEEWRCVKCGGGKPYDSAPPVFGPDDPEDETTILGDDEEPPAEEPCAECAHEYNSSECRQCKPPDWSHFTHEGEPPAEELKNGCPNCHETVTPIYADPENNVLRCPECRYVWDVL